MIQGSLFIYTIAICAVIIICGMGRDIIVKKKKKS